jgi:hypothetical protein
MRLVLSSTLASVIAFAAGPALAQVYKWVDDKGVVNYSTEAPASRKATLLDPKSSRLSVVGTDDAQKKGLTLATANERALSDKIDRLERKLDAERYARSVADSQSQAQTQAAADSWYQQCLRDRRVDCEYAGMDPYYDPSYYGYGPYGYWPVVIAKTRPLRGQGMPHHPIATPRMGGRASFAPAPRPM